jgi:hypothetical protein
VKFQLPEQSPGPGGDNAKPTGGETKPASMLDIMNSVGTENKG